MTEPRKRNPAWRDATSNERQRRRQAALDAAAQGAGFESWSQLETAVVNGATVIVTTTHTARRQSGRRANAENEGRRTP